MSFGFSPSDIVTLVNIVTKVYRAWKDAPGKCADIVSDLEYLLFILDQLTRLAQVSNSISVGDEFAAKGLGIVLQRCRKVASELNAIVTRYNTASTGGNWSKHWTRIILSGSDLNDLQARLGRSITELSSFLNIVQVEALERHEHGQRRIEHGVSATLRTVQGLAGHTGGGVHEIDVPDGGAEDEVILSNVALDSAFNVCERRALQKIDEGLAQGAVRWYKWAIALIPQESRTSEENAHRLITGYLGLAHCFLMKAGYKDSNPSRTAKYCGEAAICIRKASKFQSGCLFDQQRIQLYDFLLELTTKDVESGLETLDADNRNLFCSRLRDMHHDLRELEAPEHQAQFQMYQTLIMGKLRRLGGEVVEV